MSSRCFYKDPIPNTVHCLQAVRLAARVSKILGKAKRKAARHALNKLHDRTIDLVI